MYQLRWAKGLRSSAVWLFWSSAVLKINGNKREVFERIAKFVALGVMDDEICRIFGCSSVQLEEIRGDAEYLAIYGDLMLERAEDVSARNDGWDAVEAASIETLLLSKQFWDRDFALKVGMVANKAARRELVGRTIDGTNPNGRVVVHLNQTFVNQISENGVNLRGIDNVQVPRKQQDFLGAGEVESLLMSDSAKLTKELSVLVNDDFDNADVDDVDDVDDESGTNNG